MKNSGIIKVIILASPGNTRRRGRPRLRWVEAVEEYCSILKTKNLSSLAAGRKKNGSKGLDPP